MSQTSAVPAQHGHEHGHLRRTVGFWGLMFVSLGSIIGSGWLLSALSASEVAGPAAVLSWILAVVMLTAVNSAIPAEQVKVLVEVDKDQIASGLA